VPGLAGVGGGGDTGAVTLTLPGAGLAAASDAGHAGHAGHSGHSGHAGHAGHGAELLRALASGERADALVGVRTIPGRAGVTGDWPDWVPAVLVARLAAGGVAAPWEHQVAAATIARGGEHVILATGTGSGKSLAYLLPAVAAALDPAAAPLRPRPVHEPAGDERDGSVRWARTAARRWRAPLPPAVAGPGGSRRATTLYLAPTKALAADQHRAIEDLAVPGFRAGVVDGDTGGPERDWARDHASLVLSNPEMLHHTLLAAHARWARFLAGLRYVVLDECHGYRGVFGAHVALLVRRLRRVAAWYGADPAFVLASATVANPEQVAGRLVGAPVRAVVQDSSPRGAAVLGLWEPPADPVTGLRRPAPAEAARLLADLVAQGQQTLAFVRSRRAAETVALAARARLAGHVQITATAAAGPAAADGPAPAAPAGPAATRAAVLGPPAVAAYRGGYLPEDRRALEQALRSGALRGLAATNALELGIDVRGLDAVVMAGFPGTRASLWQQAGRAGRAGANGLAVLVARQDPLDTYLIHHPEALLDAPVEANVFDAANPHVLAPHLCAAAAELPLRPDELGLFAADPGESAAAAGVRVGRLLAELSAAGVLRRRAAGWFWTRRDRASDLADLRGSGGTAVALVAEGTGRLLGTVDAAAAPLQAHPGAVLLHRGRAYRVLCWERGPGEAGAGSRGAGGPVAAVLRPEVGDLSTTARSVSDIRVVDSDRRRRLDEGMLSFGTVEVSTRVTSYLLRRASTGAVIGEEPLEMPEQRLRTRAVWWTLPAHRVAAAGVAAADLAGAVHAAEHAAIGMLPLLASCDRWDIGGVSTALHPDTGLPTVFVHDGLPGGAGFAERGHACAEQWLAATRDQIRDCPCPTGCPSCVQSPKCGNGNHPLHKAAALALLRQLVGPG